MLSIRLRAALSPSRGAAAIECFLAGSSLSFLVALLNPPRASLLWILFKILFSVEDFIFIFSLIKTAFHIFDPTNQPVASVECVLWRLNAMQQMKCGMYSWRQLTLLSSQSCRFLMGMLARNTAQQTVRPHRRSKISRARASSIHGRLEYGFFENSARLYVLSSSLVLPRGPMRCAGLEHIYSHSSRLLCSCRLIC